MLGIPLNHHGKHEDGADIVVMTTMVTVGLSEVNSDW